jgi:hypothetical protein
MTHSRGPSLLIQILSLVLIFSSISAIQAHASEDLNKVEVIAPNQGSKLIPEKSTIVLRFTGPQALKTNVCDREFRFWMLGTDASGRSALFSRIYNLSSDEGLILMEGHTSKVIPNGIECSIDLGKQIQSRSNTQVSDMKYKSDWAKTYLTEHKLPSDPVAINNFVEGWNYLVKNPNLITRVTFSSLGLINSFTLQPVSFVAISGAREVQVPSLIRGATLSTGTPLAVKYSGAPNEIPKSISIFIKSASNSGVRECLLHSNDTKPSSRTELTYLCRIPRIYAPGQAEINAIATDSANWELVTEPVVVNLVKSSNENLKISANASECKSCGVGVIKLSGKVDWISDDGAFPLFNQDLTVCGDSCDSPSFTKTNRSGEFSVELRFNDKNPSEPWVANWVVFAYASDLESELRGQYTFTRPIKVASKSKEPPTTAEPNFTLRLNLTTKAKINWGDQVVGIVTASGKGSGTCIAQFQKELVTFSLKAGQKKSIRFSPQYAENKKFALNVGCSPNPNWWGGVFDPRYSWYYAKAKTFKYVTMVVSSNLDGY